jgi:predicted esterase
LQDLEAYLVSEGPFDAVMGFSQGASLAATYMVRKAQQDQTSIDPIFKCAIFICGGEVFDLEGEGAVLNPSLRGQVIDVPTAHIVGSKDQYCQASLRLIEICNRKSRVVYDHGGGHDVPRDTKATKEMVSTIKEVLDKAHLTQ